MKCQMVSCNGQLDETCRHSVKIGCWAYTSAYPCITCGRLHFADGTLVSTRAGFPVYTQNGQRVDLQNTHLIAYAFRTEAAWKRRRAKQALFVGEVAAVADMGLVEGPWVLYWNPQKKRWMPAEDAKTLLK